VASAAAATVADPLAADPLGGHTLGCWADRHSVFGGAGGGDGMVWSRLRLDNHSVGIFHSVYDVGYPITTPCKVHLEPVHRFHHNSTSPRAVEFDRHLRSLLGKK
jgi:hypothetical protein